MPALATGGIGVSGVSNSGKSVIATASHGVKFGSWDRQRCLRWQEPMGQVILADRRPRAVSAALGLHRSERKGRYARTEYGMSAKTASPRGRWRRAWLNGSRSGGSSGEHWRHEDPSDAASDRAAEPLEITFRGSQIPGVAAVG